MKNIIIIGGGISGFVTAIKAKNSNNNVTIIERMEEPLKKLLVTGNGRCNFFNVDMDRSHFHSEDTNKLNAILDEMEIDKVIPFIDELGVTSKMKFGCYYPSTNKAETIKEALLRKTKHLGINIITNAYVTNIKKDNNKFIITYNNTDTIKSDYLVISVGGSSMKSCGTDGSSYHLLNNLGIKLNRVLPSLTKLEADSTINKAWNGIRTDVDAKLVVDKEIIKEESGEIQLTSYGISGIVIFNLSREAVRAIVDNKEVVVYLNFLPQIEYLPDTLDRLTKLNHYKVRASLKGLLNSKLVDAIFKEFNLKDDYYDKLSKREQDEILRRFTRYEAHITNFKGFEHAEVTMGGVSLNELDNNFKSAKIDNLYFTGEVIDIDGDVGGYNITHAITSGIKVGTKINNETK